jgi:methionyl-tRNA synthetase
MLQALNGLKVLFAPYTPFSSQKLHALLGFEGDVTACSWAATPVPAGQALPSPTPLFAKFDAPASATAVAG